MRVKVDGHLMLKLMFFGALPFSALCQESPRFQTNLYFEDALGNRDTITVGFDVNATPETDVNFGEIVDETPMDSIFDVRAVDPSAAIPILYKKLVTRSTNGAPDPYNCLTGGGAEIFVHCVHQPFKMQWDKSEFLDSTCYRGAFVTNQISWELTEVSLDNFPGITYCLADTNEAEYELSLEAFEVDPLLARLEIEHEVEGQGELLIYGLSLSIGETIGFTPCYWITSVSDISLETSINLYPNPCYDLLQVQGESVSNLKNIFIYNSIGQFLRQQSFGGNESIDVSYLHHGIHYLFGEFANGEIAYLGEFIKQ